MSDALQELAQPRWYDHVLGLGRLPTPPPAATRYDDLQAAQPQIQAVSQYLKDTYGVDPMLYGSMPLGLNVPGTTDLDFNTIEGDKARYQELVARLAKDSKFTPGKLNVPGTAFQTYKAPAGAFGEHPVDFTLAHGDTNARFQAALRQREQRAAKLPDDVVEGLLQRRTLLKNSPLDIGGLQYQAFKHKLNDALSDGKKELFVREKLARILSPNTSPEDAARLDAYLNAPNVYGHRTAHGETLLESGKLMSGLHALQQKKLKTYESGFLPGLRGQVEAPNLSREQLDTLSRAWLRETPNYSEIDALGDRTGLKASLLQNRLKDVNRHLEGMDPERAEAWRVEHLRIPKLSPHTFLTQGGLIRDEGYGDTGFLFRTNKAKASPFVTLIQNEAVLSPDKALRMRAQPLRNALVVGRGERLKDLEARFPDYTYVDEAELEQRGKLLDTYSVGSAVRRLAPQVLDGTARVRQG